MVFGVEKHAVQHGRFPHDAREHASFVCTWMCAATTYVHSVDQAIRQQFVPVFDVLTTFGTEKILLNKPLLALYSRPPPFILL